MTLVLLDTNTYLRLAKRISPMLGVTFGQKGYVLTILKQVEDEVHANPRLQFLYPWFDGPEFANERLATRVRLNRDEKQLLDVTTSVLRAHVLSNATTYTSQNRTPPSPIDCFILAFWHSARFAPPSSRPTISACTCLPETSIFLSGMGMNC